MTIDWSIFSALIIAIGSLVTAIATRYQSKDHTNLTAVEMAEKVMKIADVKLNEMIADLTEMRLITKTCQEEIRDLQIQVEHLRKENGNFIKGIELLCHQLKSMGQVPVWCLPRLKEGE